MIFPGVRDPLDATEHEVVEVMIRALRNALSSALARPDGKAGVIWPPRQAGAARPAGWCGSAKVPGGWCKR